MIKEKVLIEQLAFMGGEPAFPYKLHVGSPNKINRDRLFQRINGILDRNWLTNRGPLVREFEQKIAEMIGVKHCIAMCNGTIALEIAIRALDLSGEVILPSLTFIATAHALQWQQITPVFCDVDPDTFTLDAEKVEKMITPKTTGIIGVHLWGRACEISELSDIARKNNLKILFDAAHAFGCTYKGNMIGSFGDVEVLSFHATKFFNTFEGGAVVTNDDNIAEKIRLMQNFGFVDMDKVIYIGTNGKMSEVSAAMGLTSLESLKDYVEINHSHYQQYKNELGDIPGIRMIEYSDSEQSNYQYIVLEIDENVTVINRDQIMEILHAENIIARRYFYPGCHRMEPYKSYFPNAGILLPVTEKITERILLLPTGTAITSKDIDKICSIIKLIISNSFEILESSPKTMREILV